MNAENMKELVKRLLPWVIIATGFFLFTRNLGGSSGLVDEGTDVPNLTVTTTTGDSFQLHEVEGVTVLNFWASWCGPCRQEAPALTEISKEMYDTDRFVGLSVENMNDNQVTMVAGRLGMLFDVGTATQEHSQTFGVRNLPTTYVIGSDHKVAAHFVGAVSEGALRQAIADAR